MRTPRLAARVSSVARQAKLSDDAVECFVPRTLFAFALVLTSYDAPTRPGQYM